jgi:U5 small nuclear ribonucleoprotein component
MHAGGCCHLIGTCMCAQVPIIAPIKQRKLEVLERAPLPTRYSNEFLAGLMTNPELVRNVAICGHLHHGKTLVRCGFSQK